MKNFYFLTNLFSPAAGRQSNVVRVRDGQQPTNLQLISNLSLTHTPFRLVKWVAVLCLLVTLGVGNVWGTDAPIYTLTPYNTGSDATSTGYANATNASCEDEDKEVTIVWNVTGNTNQVPWRIGGKASSSGVTDTFYRNIYSKSILSSANVTKVILSHGTTDLTSNHGCDSVELFVSTSENRGGTIVSKMLRTFKASDTIIFTRPAGADWSDKYFTIRYKIHVKGTSNKHLQFVSAVFYASTGCSNYSFHYQHSSDWNTDNICFTQVSTSVNYLTDELSLPYAEWYNVTGTGNGGHGASSAQTYGFTGTTDNVPMPFYHYRSKSFGANPQSGNIGGGLGRFHVYGDSNSKNKYVSFIPTYYTLNFGTGDTWTNDSTLVLSPASSDWDETDFYSPITTLSNAAIGRKIFVGLKTTSGYVWCSPYSVKENLSGLRTKSNSGNNWVDGGLTTSYASKRGKFRVYANSGDNNWYVTFIPHHRIIYHANYPVGDSPADTYSVDVSVEETNSSISLNSAPSAPTGYTFDGWYTAASGGTKRTGNQTISAGASADVELYAHWTETLHDVTVEYKCGATSLRDNTTIEDVGITTTGTTTAPASFTGYTWSTWSSMPSGVTTSTTPLTTRAIVINATADGKTITANYTANKYDVTLKPTSQTGSLTDQVVQATYGSAMPTTVKTAGTAIVIPERTGYTFTGWFDNSSGGKQYYQYTGSPKTLSSANTWDKTSATNLYAQWSINSYTLTWSWGGGSTSATSGDDYTAAGSVVYNTALSYPADNTMSRNGYTFNGWSSDATNMPAENLTITAQWTANQYTVTLDNKSATTAGTESVIATFGQAIPTITPPTKTGYRFDGYWTTASGGTKYINADGTSAHTYDKYSADPTAHKLHAHWVAQIEFSVNGVVDDELTCDVTASLPSSATVPTSCGDCWAFAGWDASSTCSTTPGHAGGEGAATHGITTPTTLYAVFGKAEYKLIYDLSDLEANEYYVLTYLDNDDNERALTNSITNTKYATATDITSDLKENADGWYLYNPPVSIIWKFTGTTSSGRLYNEAASKYLDLSSTSNAVLQSSTSDNLNFTKFSSSLFNIASTTQTSYYLYMYTNPFWGVDNDHDGYPSCYIYKRQSATYATEPGCESYDIVWKVDGSTYSTGSPTEETNTCAGIETLPTAPSNSSLDCAEKFMGWSESKLIGIGKSAPADLFNSVGHAPAIDENKTFYAVFASVDEETKTPTDHSVSISTSTFTEINTTGYTTTFNHTYTIDSIGTTGSLPMRAYGVYNNSGIQMNKGKGTYIKNLYAFPGPIKKIEITWSGTSNNTPTIYAAKDAVASSSSTSLGTLSSGVSSHTINVDVANGYNYFYFDGNAVGGVCVMTELKITYVDTVFGYKDYMTSCCDELVELSTNSPSNGTITFDPVSPIATCDANQNVTMTITPAAGYKLSEWTVATGDGKVAASSTSPAVVTGEDNSDEQEIALTFNQHLSGTYAVSATFEQMHDEYYDYMHDNAKVGGNRTGSYFAPSRTSKTAGKTANDCKGNHYKFKGWVVSSEINDDGTLKSGYTLITAGTSMTASNKIYYAVWAEEADE